MMNEKILAAASVGSATLSFTIEDVTHIAQLLCAIVACASGVVALYKMLFKKSNPNP